MTLRRDPLVSESPSADLTHELVHAGRVTHLAGAVAVIELRQVAAKVLVADAVVRAVDAPPELAEIALDVVRGDEPTGLPAGVLVIGVVDRLMGDELGRDVPNGDPLDMVEADGGDGWGDLWSLWLRPVADRSERLARKLLTRRRPLNSEREGANPERVGSRGFRGLFVSALGPEATDV